jgi:predicted kinase
MHKQRRRYHLDLFGLQRLQSPSHNDLEKEARSSQKQQIQGEQMRRNSMKPELIMLIGLPGCGKSTIAQKYYADRKIFSSDALRKELFDDEDCQDKNDELFKELHKRIREALKQGHDVIYDACNISYKRRMAFLQEMKKYYGYATAMVIMTPYEECVARQKERNRDVPEEVIFRMYKNFFFPQKYEGWDAISAIETTYRNSKALPELFDRIDKITQDNPNHTRTIGEHCKKVSEAVCRHYIDNYVPNTIEKVAMAALLHDIGKEKTKAFNDKNGEPTKEAHYFGHMNASAYDAAILLSQMGMNQEQMLGIVALIQWHMILFNVGGCPYKIRKLLGEETWKQLKILHECDMKGR